MPYELSHRKVDGKEGWVVRNKESGKIYSDHALSHDDALAQLRAIEMHTHGKSEEEIHALGLIVRHHGEHAA